MFFIATNQKSGTPLGLLSSAGNASISFFKSSSQSEYSFSPVTIRLRESYKGWYNSSYFSSSSRRSSEYFSNNSSLSVCKTCKENNRARIFGCNSSTYPELNPTKPSNLACNAPINPPSPCNCDNALTISCLSTDSPAFALAKRIFSKAFSMSSCCSFCFEDGIAMMMIRRDSFLRDALFFGGVARLIKKLCSKRKESGGGIRRRNPNASMKESAFDLSLSLSLSLPFLK